VDECECKCDEIRRHQDLYRGESGLAEINQHRNKSLYSGSELVSDNQYYEMENIIEELVLNTNYNFYFVKHMFCAFNSDVILR
jgi:hypothetical protein